MDLGSILFILAIVLLTGFYIGRPLFEKNSKTVTAKDQQISTLLSEQERILEALHELDFDNQLKKIPESEYPVQRNLLLTAGADVLRQLDELQPTKKQAESAPRTDPLEAAIAERKRTKTAASQPDDELEALIAQRRRVQKETTGGFCPQCGHTIKKSDKFCAKCGSTI